MLLTLAATLPLLSAPQSDGAETLFVVTSLPYIADVVRQVGGEDVEAVSLVAPGVDPHHVELTPAQLSQLRRSDLFLENGMQLESWAPRVLEASGRAELAQGGSAHAFVTNGIRPLEVPTAAEAQAGGHSHAAGNPHAWLDPLNLKVVANNVADALSAVAPERRSAFQERYVEYAKRVDAAFFGEELEALLGGRTLDRLHRSGRLIDFLEGREVRGEKLSGKLGGWLGRARALPEKKVFTYHRTWSYLEQAFDLEVVATLEEKPGIAPGPAYLEELSGRARSEGVRLVLAPPFYPSVRIEGFAERIGGTALILPTQPGEAEQTDDLFRMFDRILATLETASIQR
ncbi:MAG: metal ABC transporter substrate-binding protein [Planctomycetota bacterium]